MIAEAVAHTLLAKENDSHAADLHAYVCHALRGEGFDASEDGTGRGTPIVPVLARTLTRGAESRGKGGYAGRRQEDDDQTVGALAAEPGAKQQCYLAEPFTIMERGRAGGSNLEYRQDGTTNAVLTPNGGRGGLGVGAIATRWAVRRLTPTECERLQGFPNGYTMIPWRGKPAGLCPDGPRYKALGNSMAVPVMAWIGARLDAELRKVMP